MKKVVFVYPESGKTLDWSDLRKQVLMRDNHKCQMCGARGGLEVHHIKPRAAGGANTPGNLIALCPECHDIAEDEKLMTQELIRNWRAGKVLHNKRQTPAWRKPTVAPPVAVDTLPSIEPRRVDDEPDPVHIPNSELPVLFEWF